MGFNIVLFVADSQGLLPMGRRLGVVALRPYLTLVNGKGPIWSYMTTWYRKCRANHQPEGCQKGLSQSCR